MPTVRNLPPREYWILVRAHHDLDDRLIRGEFIRHEEMCWLITAAEALLKGTQDAFRRGLLLDVVMRWSSLESLARRAKTAGVLWKRRDPSPSPFPPRPKPRPSP